MTCQECDTQRKIDKERYGHSTPIGSRTFRMRYLTLYLIIDGARVLYCFSDVQRGHDNLYTLVTRHLKAGFAQCELVYQNSEPLFCGCLKCYRASILAAAGLAKFEGRLKVYEGLITQLRNSYAY